MAKCARNTQNQAEPAAEAQSFEALLAEVETVVAQLEAGEKPLEESLALYEKGVAALRRCHAVLDQAEKRIHLLVKGPNGEPLLRQENAPGK
jgi:exodeoxyribonuclease VII small subunit